MNSDMIICIGWARAGSTAMRRNFLGRHPGLAVAGRDQAESQGPAAEILHIIKTASDDDFVRQAPVLQAAWDNYRRRSEAIVCLSDEELSIGLPGRIRPADLARRCARLFPEARILAVVREQVEAIGSFYGLAQRDAFRDQTPFPDWLDRHFLAPTDGGFAYLYAHAATLDAYAVGRSRADILAIDHRRLREDSFGAYSVIAQWMGVSQEACGDLPDTTLNASPDGHPPWPSERLDAVRALYEADNHRLAASYGIAFGPHRQGRRRGSPRRPNA